MHYRANLLVICFVKRPVAWVFELKIRYLTYVLCFIPHCQRTFSTES